MLELKTVLDIAQKTGLILKVIYEQEGNIEIQEKKDLSPLTKADLMANDYVVKALSQAFKGIPVISEEDCDIDFTIRQKYNRYWLVDPLDGTKEFIEKTGEFSVNIALMENNKPILGVIDIPMLGVSYFAKEGIGAFKVEQGSEPRPIQTRKAQFPYWILTSRRHGLARIKAYLKKLQTPYKTLAKGSALKACLIAEGQADCYPRLGPTSEWDTAASHCILRCAGGDILNLHGQALTYNDKQDYIQPDFIAFGDSSVEWLKWLGISNKNETYD